MGTYNVGMYKVGQLEFGSIKDFPWLILSDYAAEYFELELQTLNGPHSFEFTRFKKRIIFY